MTDREWHEAWRHYAKLRHVVGIVGRDKLRRVVCSCGQSWTPIS